MEFKGTKGEWFSCCKDSTPHFLFANDGEQTIASFNIKQDDGTSLPIEDVRANAELIEDAGNVRQKIDCSLPELLEQRNELLEALEVSLEALEYSDKRVHMHPVNVAIDKAQQAINKTK